MQIREISYYKDFRCLAASCRETCCHGWMIPLTDEDYDRFMKEESLLGRRLILSVRTASAGQRVLNYSCRTCRFLNREGLCRVQLKKGHDFIPQVCRDYPRFFRNYLFFEERLIDLSCEKGAELFLASLPLTFRIYEGEPESLPCCTNEDSDFFNALSRTRGAMISAFESLASFDELSLELEKVLLYCKSCEQSFLLGNTDFLTKHPYETFSCEFRYEKRLLPFDSDTIREIMQKEFRDLPLAKTNPTLSGLCKLYFKTTGHHEKTGDSSESLLAEFISSHPEDCTFFASFFVYYLYGYFLQNYEDYSFSRNASLGIIHLNLLLLFLVLGSEAEGTASAERKASILSSYYKKGFYNEELQNEMYEIFKTRFPDPLSPSPAF